MSVAEKTRTLDAWLVPLAGPPLEPIVLRAGAGQSLLIGRHDDCQIKLPPDADKVSRFHARFMCDGERWQLSDQNSRWGTYVNGVKLAPNLDIALREGDLIRITPWTFSFRNTPPARRGLLADDDLQRNQTLVRSIRFDQVQPLSEDVATLLLESAAGIHAAADEKQLAEVLLDVACRGSGLPNAALLRPLDAGGRIEVIASRLSPHFQGQSSFSRSLLAAASNGDVAELGSLDAAEIGQSIVQMNITAAICVPLMLGNTVAAYLYLDARGRSGMSTAVPHVRPNAVPFLLALGRMAGLAMSNLKRIDIERRQASVQAELEAAAEATRWILPPRTGKVGRFSYLGESRAGRYIGGDFFDVIPIDDHRIAVALGDVAGKGVAASVLMNAAHGCLHATLRDEPDVAKAITILNRFVHPRRPENRFLTLWVGLFDLNEKKLTYVDAGHGYGLMAYADGSFAMLNEGGGLPIGVMDDWTYIEGTAELKPGARAIIVSDGIVEQFGAPDEGGEKNQFEMEGVTQALSTLPSGTDEIAHIFERLIAHAGTTQLADDATILCVRWEM
jgi:sigma-B regulation protein RsbU (phosphoserine phosphatase)